MTTIHLKTEHGFIEPEDELSRVLLRHCAEGSESVSLDEWAADVKPVVEAHGWAWEIKPEKDEPQPEEAA